jgi:hypothetical protein
MPSESKLAVFEVKAREAAGRLDRAAGLGRQLSLIPAEASPADPGELERRGPGRPQGARNKRTSKLRQMLAARGFRMPEDVLSEIAGLSARVSSVELAMQRAEQVLAWAHDGAEEPATPGQRLAVFLACHKEATQAAAALLPYGLERMTPDQVAPAVTVLQLPGQARPGDRARVIEGSASDCAPPPLPLKFVENQAVEFGQDPGSDGASRTDGASDG